MIKTNSLFCVKNSFIYWFKQKSMRIDNKANYNTYSSILATGELCCFLALGISIKPHFNASLLTIGKVK